MRYRILSSTMQVLSYFFQVQVQVHRQIFFQVRVQVQVHRQIFFQV